MFDDDPQILGLAFWLTIVSLYVHEVAIKPKYTTTDFNILIGGPVTINTRCQTNWNIIPVNTLT